MTTRKALVLELILGGLDLYERFLTDLARSADLRTNVIRGRRSASGAWMKVAIFGEADRVDAFRRRWTEWTLSTTVLPASAA